MTPPPCALDFETSLSLYQDRSFPSFQERPLSTFPDKSYLPILVNEKKSFKCSDCEKIFRYKSDIERHISVHSETRPFACTDPTCNRSFKRAESLRDHLESHNKDLSYVCPESGCGKIFQKKSIMQYHLRKHHGAKDSACNSQKCKKAFEKLRKLKRNQIEEFIPEKEEEKTISLKDQQTETTSIFENRNSDLCAYNFEETTPYFELTPESEFAKFERSPEPKKLLYIENNEEERQPSKKSLEELIGEVQVMMAAQGKNYDLRIESLLQSVLEHLKNENQELKEKLADVLAQIENV